MFRDVARSVGLDFVHINGASPQRFLPEILGSGGLFLDFDNDGWLDVFIVDGGSVDDPTVARRARHRLYRNRGNATFEDVTTTSGIRHREYGMGACAGDYDNDGLIDLYLTAVGSNQLYHNGGRGRFTEVLNAGGANPNLWSTSCAFLDVDRDGDLDLLMTNYVDPLVNKNPFCGIAGPPPVRDYCHPLMYQPLHSVLYRNTGPSTSLGASRGFEDVSKSSGVAALRGNGLGVAVADVDDDGWPDVFVANEAMPNFLFRNDADGTFTDIAGAAGVAVTADGKAKAGMGTAFADFGGNGRLGLIAMADQLVLLVGKGELYRALAGLAQLHLDDERALGLLERAVRVTPNNAAVHRALGRAYVENGRDAEGYAELVIALLLDPDDVETLTALGRWHLTADQLARAVGALERAVRIDPTNRLAVHALAGALIRVDRVSEGKQRLLESERLQSQAIEDDRRGKTAAVLRLNAQMRMAERDYAGAVDIWRRSILLQPGRAAVHLRVAEALAAANRPDEAVAEYLAAISLKAGADAHRRLAELYDSLGRTGEAGRERAAHVERRLEELRQRAEQGAYGL